MAEAPYPAPESDWNLRRHDSPGELQALSERVALLETRDTREPWWRSARTVTVIASLIAAFVPITTGLETYLKGRADLTLAAEQQRHAMRMDYMRTALDPAAPELQRQSRLRLLVAILEAGDPARAWATEELALVDRNVQQLKSELAVTQQALSGASAEEQAARTRLAQLEQGLPAEGAHVGGDGDAPRPIPRDRALEKAKADLTALSIKKHDLASRIDKTSVRLKGQPDPLTAD